MINQLVAALPVVTFILDCIALILSLYLKRTNISLMLLACLCFAAIGYMSSIITTSLLLAIFAPWMLVLMLAISLFKERVAYFGAVLILFFFIILSFVCIHSSTFLEAAQSFNFYANFAICTVLILGLSKALKSARFVVFYIAAIWQCFFKDLFFIEYCDMLGFCILILAVLDRRKYE